MKLHFTKTKKARILCAVSSVGMLALAVYAAYYAIGNLLCASDGPILISDSGTAFFLGYYLLAGAYFLLGFVSAVFCVIFLINAIKKEPV